MGLGVVRVDEQELMPINTKIKRVLQRVMYVRFIVLVDYRVSSENISRAMRLSSSILIIPDTSTV